jgi:hypothetical protein
MGTTTSLRIKSSPEGGSFRKRKRLRRDQPASFLQGDVAGPLKHSCGDKSPQSLEFFIFLFRLPSFYSVYALSCIIMKAFLAALVAVEVASAFPFVANTPGVDSSLLGRAKQNSNPERRKRATCPFNGNHAGAAPYDSKYPYTGAKNGQPGTQVGGVKVPADGDTAHAFEAPGPNDIRGPCPGLNAAANHHV